MDYTLIRSSRRTLSIQIDRDGQLIARAPMRMSVKFIEDFIEKKRVWIEKHRQLAENRRQKAERKTYSEAEIREMKRQLMQYLIHRVRELWEGRGLPKYTSIKVTKSERRWGSCSGKNGLCFSYRLAEWLQSPPDKDENKGVLVPVMSTESSVSVTTTRHLAQNLGKNEQDFSLRFTALKMTDTTMHSPFIDAVIVHELAHLREKHHQVSFWKLVYEMMPEYESVMKKERNFDFF